MFIGDLPILEFWTSDSGRIFFNMATAIGKVFITSEGFAVGADGRKRDGATKAVLSDTTQKIFPICGPDRTLVYGFMGNPVIKDDTTGEIVVDMLSAIGQAVAAMAATNSRHDINWYVSKLSNEAYTQLVQARKNADIGPFPDNAVDPGIICHVFFWGYYRGVPVELDLRFTHENQKVLRPKAFPTPHLRQGIALYGSKIVAEKLFNNEQQFAEFRTNAMDRNEDTWNLSEGVEVLKNYIQACDSDAGRAADPDLCPGIGGHIQLATITPSGFKWVEGHSPTDKSSFNSQT